MVNKQYMFMRQCGVNMVDVVSHHCVLVLAGYLYEKVKDEECSQVH